MISPVLPADPSKKRQAALPPFRHRLTVWLLLAMSSTLAGNLTILGSIANIIVVEGARPSARIGFLEYLKVGVPLTIVTVALGALWLGAFTY